MTLTKSLDTKDRRECFIALLGWYSPTPGSLSKINVLYWHDNTSGYLMTKQYMKSGNQDVVNKMYHLNFFFKYYQFDTVLEVMIFNLWMFYINHLYTYIYMLVFFEMINHLIFAFSFPSQECAGISCCLQLNPVRFGCIIFLFNV